MDDLEGMMARRDDELLIPHCTWFEPPPDISADTGDVWNIPHVLGMPVLRLFWLTDIAPGQWRGRHAHRHSILATFMTNGRCSLSLDDGVRQQVVELSDKGKGLVIGSWIWHELTDFSPDASVLVLATTRYDENEYIRDYPTFLREVAERSGR